MMRARHRFLILLSAVAVAASAATFFILRTPSETKTPLGTTDRSVLDSAAVWVAVDGDIEYMLRPYFAETDRDDFNRRRFNENLGTTAAPRAFRSLWIVNRGKEAVPNPFSAGMTLRIADTAEAEPIDRLLAREGARIPEYFRRIAEADSVKARPTIGPQEVARVVLATPADFELESLVRPRLVREGREIGLRAGRASLVDLWRFEEAPTGSLVAFVHFGDERVPPNAVSERPRGEKN